MSKRSTRGSGFLEIIASAFFLIAMVILGLNIWILVTAATINDAACRDAARAASQGEEENMAKNLALATLATKQKQGSFFIQAPSMTMFTYRDFGASTGVPVAPPLNTSAAVTVRTEVRVRPLLPLILFGNAIIPDTDQIKFEQIYTYPLIKTKQGVKP